MKNPKKAGAKKSLESIKESPTPSVDSENDFNSAFANYAARIAKGPDTGYEIRELKDSGWIARKNAFSGSILGVTNGRLTISGKFHATATEADSARFSAIQQGQKGSSWLKKGSAGLPSVWLYMLAILSYSEKPEFLREQMIETLMGHPDFFIQKYRFDERDKEQDIGFTSFNDIKIFIGEKIADGIERYGSKFLFAISELSKRIESKEASLNKEEKDFLDAVSNSTIKAETVPLQKEVKLLWLQGRIGRTEEHFRRVRDKLALQQNLWVNFGSGRSPSV